MRRHPTRAGIVPAGAGLVALIFAILLAPLAAAQISVGPFASPQDATLARQRIGSGDLRVTEQKTESLGFIVVTPRLGDDDIARSLNELDRAGFVDIVQVRTGDYGGRISAGVYSSEALALDRVATLQAEGFEFEVLERSRLISYESWLDTRTAPGDRVLAAIEQDIGYDLTVERPEVAPAMRPEPVPPMPPETVPETARAPAEQVPPVNSEPLAATPSPDPAAMPVAPSASGPDASPRARPVSTPATEPAGTPWKWILFGAGLASLFILPVFGLIYWRASRLRQSESESYEPIAQIGYDAKDERAETKPVVTEATDTQTGSLAAALSSEDVLAQAPALLDRLSGESVETIDLIDDLVDLSRGEPALRPYTFQLADLIEEVVRGIQAERPGCQVYVQRDGSLPLVYGDADRLRRLTRNLLRHAVDPEDALTLQVVTRFGASGAESDRNQFEFIVTAAAAPLPPDEVENDDEDAASTRTRIRLSVCERLAQLLDGDLGIESDSPEGPRLALSVPLALVEQDVELQSGETLGDVLHRYDDMLKQSAINEQSIEDMERQLAREHAALELARSQARKLREAAAARETADRARIRELERERTEIESHADESTSRIAALEASLADARGAADAAAAEQQASTEVAEARVRELEESLDAVRISLKRAQDEQARLRTDAETRARELDERNAAMSAELESLQQTEARRQRAAQDATAEIDRMIDEVNAARYAATEAERARQKAETERDALKRQLSRPIVYTLPESERGAIMMENFVAQMGTRVLELESSVGRGDRRSASQIARWIGKYADGFDMIDVAEQSDKVLRHLEAGSAGTIDQVHMLTDIYSRIELQRPDSIGSDSSRAHSESELS